MRGTKETAKEAARRYSASQLKDGFKPQGLHIYCDRKGTPLYWRIRLKNPSTGEKWIRPMFLNGNGFKLGEPNFTGLKPLYRLHDIVKKESKKVYLVEGEYCADKLAKLGVLATTSGASNSAGTVDWEPLKGRNVVIWPDNDEAGGAYAKECEAILLNLGCQVSIIDVQALDLPPKGDCVDFLANKSKQSAGFLEELPLNKVSENQEEWEAPIPLTALESKSLDFPIYAFPEVIGEAVLEYQAYGQQPLALVAVSALSNLSLACQGLANVARDSHLVGPVSLYSIVVAESGERKTSADKAFGKAIREWVFKKLIELEPEITQYKADYSIWKAQREGIQAKIKRSAGNGNKKEDQIEKLKEKLKELEANPPKIVQVPKLFYEIATQQALISDLSTGWPSASLWSDESGVILGSHGMSSERITEFLALLNKLWDGGVVTKRTQSSGACEIRGRRFTCSLMFQGVLLDKLVNGTDGISRGTGFLARTLICRPVSSMGSRVYLEPPAGFPYLAKFHDRLVDLLDMELPVNEQGFLEPPALDLDASAKKVWVQYYNEIETQLQSEGLFSDIKDFTSKSAENAVRLAACFHIIEFGPVGTIGESSMSRAVEIAKWFLFEAKRILGDNTKLKHLNEARTLLDWLKKQGKQECLGSHISQYGPNRFRETSTRTKALALLRKHKFVKVKKQGSGINVVMNPAIFRDKAAANSAN